MPLKSRKHTKTLMMSHRLFREKVSRFVSSTLQKLTTKRIFLTSSNFSTRIYFHIKVREWKIQGEKEKYKKFRFTSTRWAFSTSGYRRIKTLMEKYWNLEISLIAYNSWIQIFKLPPNTVMCEMRWRRGKHDSRGCLKKSFDVC